MSGWSRHVSSRNSPSVPRIVGRPPRTCPRALRSAPGGWLPWVGWSELLRVAEQDERARRRRAGERRSRASSGPPRRRTARRGPARASPSRPATQATTPPPTTSIRSPRSAATTSALSLIEVAPSKVGSLSSLGFWPMRTATPSSCDASATFFSRFPMTLWLLAATPTFCPACTSADDHLRARVGLARPGRALDRQHRPVEERRQRGRPASSAALAGQPQVAVRGPAPARGGGGAAGPRAASVASRAAVGVESPCAATHSPIAQDALAPAPSSARRGWARASAAGRTPLAAATLEVEDAVDVVDRRRPPRRACPVAGSSTSTPASSFVVLGREPVASRRRTACPAAASPIVAEPADRLAFADELLLASSSSKLEVAPPGRLLLAPVPGEQLGEQPACRAASGVRCGRRIRATPRPAAP